MASDDVDKAKRKLRAEKRAARTSKDRDSTPAPNPEPTKDADGPASGPKRDSLRIKDLVESVVATTGGNKAQVKKTVEAVLEAIGIALATGRDLNVPPLGKLRVAKNQQPIMTLKLRLADGPRAAGLPLADEEEDS